MGAAKCAAPAATTAQGKQCLVTGCVVHACVTSCQQQAATCIWHVCSHAPFALALHRRHATCACFGKLSAQRCTCSMQQLVRLCLTFAVLTVLTSGLHPSRRGCSKGQGCAAAYPAALYPRSSCISDPAGDTAHTGAAGTRPQTTHTRGALSTATDPGFVSHIPTPVQAGCTWHG